VNTAVTQMDRVVQQNATLVEEATAATESMKAQAESLQEMVARFKLDAGARQPQARAVVPTVFQAAPRVEPPAQGAPIRFQPAAPAAPTLAQLAGAASSDHARRPNGEWKEF
jgi:methyl-accepting chemotaxis protein